MGTLSYCGIFVAIPEEEDGADTLEQSYCGTTHFFARADDTFADVLLEVVRQDIYFIVFS
jgi:hypothetical protein